VTRMVPRTWTSSWTSSRSSGPSWTIMVVSLTPALFIDKDVEPAVGVDRLADHALGRILVGHAAVDAHGLAALGANLGARSLGQTRSGGRCRRHWRSRQGLGAHLAHARASA